MFTQLAHTATGKALEAESWCVYSLPAAIAPVGAIRLAGEAGLGRTRFGRMSLVQPSLAIGSNDRPPGAFL